VMFLSVRDLFPGPWVDQQNNTPCNAAKKVKKRMEECDVRSLSWPANRQIPIQLRTYGVRLVNWLQRTSQQSRRG